MLKIGDYNTLEIVKELDFGMYLDGGAYGEILLPTRYIPDDIKVGDDLEVFIYTDSEDRLIATTLRPLAKAGDIAFLKVKEVGRVGAFLEWGLPKDLLVPFREQHVEMEAGKSYLVKVMLDDKTDRLIGSSRLSRFVEARSTGLEEGQEVELLLASRSDIGYKTVVNGKFWGLLYANEVFTELHQGQEIKGYIKKVRPDGKLDVSLQPQGYTQQIPVAAQALMRQIQQHNGFLPLTDKSAPEEIYRLLKMSKKAFKKALGMLYRQRMVTLEHKGVRLIDENEIKRNE